MFSGQAEEQRADPFLSPFTQAGCCPDSIKPKYDRLGISLSCFRSLTLVFLLFPPPSLELSFHISHSLRDSLARPCVFCSPSERLCEAAAPGGRHIGGWRKGTPSPRCHCCSQLVTIRTNDAFRIGMVLVITSLLKVLCWSQGREVTF